ncbi:MAG TPA: NADH-quinone oxidoreductase subunit L [Pyrinomonadaceae bacterium]|jgi:NADH-quinone oxidoreductase subunit L|nr:NADH-quinone oxidoreductase subunit L [Pyrinomonadaceae bacterium]
MLRYIIFAPLLGAAVCWLVGRRVRDERFIGAVACGSVLVSALVAFYLAFGSPGVLVSNSTQPVFDHLWTWLDVGTFRADFGFAMDRLSGIYVCFITFVGFLIHLFATGYMHGDRSFYRFFAYLNLFMFMMLTLVLADNLLLMFVGWEGVGLCSYLLIGYYIDRKEAGDAAKKAFVANRVGDWGVVLGIMLVFFLTGSISFFDKSPQVTGGAEVASALQAVMEMPVEAFTWHALFAGGVTSAALLLFIGATGKSAQIPLFVWLPDAMAGPTPVSALIHAATMVTAGVYMIVRCSAIFSHAPATMFVVAVIGALTAIFAATIGIAQNDIKKVLAYSTVSQLGYMMLACGVGAFVAAIFHVMTHAFFKALLFLGSGSVIHGMHHEQDMRRMGGLKKYMPVTFATMAVGWLAISGFPLLSGFFSKDEILWKTWSANVAGFPEYAGKILGIVGALTAGLTAVYMTRLMVLTFWGAERFREAHAGGQADEAHAHAADEGDKPHDAQLASAGDRPRHAPGEHAASHLEADLHARGGHAPAGETDFIEEEEHEEHHHGPVEPRESPWTMTVPLVVLAILSAVGGLVGVPYALSGGALPNYFERALEPVVARAPESGGEASHGPNAVAHAAGESPRPPAAHGNEGAVPQSVGEGELGAPPAAEHAHDPAEVSRERIFTGISIVIGLAGIALGWTYFKKRPLAPMPRLLENKYYVDEIYDAALINPIKSGSREGLWKIFDVGVIDGLVNGVAQGMRGLGAAARRIQQGFVRGYAAIILVGALAVIGYFVFVFGRVTFFR